MKLGISTKALSYGQSFSKDFLKSLKVKAIEYYAATTNLTDGPERIKKFKKLSKEFNLSFHAKEAVSHQQNKAYENHLYYWYKYFIEYAEKIPFNNFSFHMPLELGPKKREKEILAQLKNAKMLVSVENNFDKNKYAKLENVKAFAEQNGFRPLIDIGHLYVHHRKKFLQELETYDLGKVGYAHVHDVIGNDDHQEIGKGEIGLNNTLKALDIIKPKYVIVEMNTPEAAKNSLEKIRKQL